MLMKNDPQNGIKGEIRASGWWVRGVSRCHGRPGGSCPIVQARRCLPAPHHCPHYLFTGCHLGGQRPHLARRAFGAVGGQGSTYQTHRLPVTPAHSCPPPTCPPTTRKLSNHIFSMSWGHKQCNCILWRIALIDSFFRLNLLVSFNIAVARKIYISPPKNIYIMMTILTIFFSY